MADPSRCVPTDTRRYGTSADLSKIYNAVLYLPLVVASALYIYRAVPCMIIIQKRVLVRENLRHCVITSLRNCVLFNSLNSLLEVQQRRPLFAINIRIRLAEPDCCGSLVPKLFLEI